MWKYKRFTSVMNSLSIEIQMKAHYRVRFTCNERRINNVFNIFICTTVINSCVIFRANTIDFQLKKYN